MINAGRVALVTGGARRIGAAICRELHARDWQVLIHCQRSQDDARALAAELNQVRGGSAQVLCADLCDAQATADLARSAVAKYGALHALVNNASAFYPTPVGAATAEQWDELMHSNLRAPYFLAQSLAPALAGTGGSIVNLVDIHAERPMRNHSIYSMAKAGLQMMTRSLALELAPDIRVNAVAPGAILWPEQDATDARAEILQRIPLRRIGEPADIAGTVRFLLEDAPYITGQVIAVDGGRSLNM